MQIKRPAWLSATRAKTLVYYILVVGTPSSIFLWRLSSQTSGLGPSEAAIRSSAKLSNVASNTLNLPYKLLENGLYHSGLSHIFALRLGSAIIGLAIVAAFFYVLKSWFGKPIALLSVLLFALTPLYLLSARIASGSIMFVSPIFLLFAYCFWGRTKRKLAAYILISLGLSICLYTPGVIWVIVPTIIFWRKNLLVLWNELTARYRVFLSSFILLLLLPLIYRLVDLSILKSWLLLPQHLPGLAQLVKNLAWTVSDLFIHSRSGADLNIGNIPILDAVQVGLLIFGVYVCWMRLRSVLYWVATSVLIVLLVTAINPGQEQLLLTLPFIAFLCGMGLRYLYLEWREVFPKNPLAKGFAITLMSAIVSIHVLYGIRYSIIAWPATPRIAQTYVIK